jgi:hypothetical protein
MQDKDKNQDISYTKFLSGLKGKFRNRMIESVRTRYLRDFTDVEIRNIKSSSRNNHAKIILYCKLTGHWLGDWAVPNLEFKNQELSEKYQHKLEFWLLEDKLISQRYLAIFDEEK